MSQPTQIDPTSPQAVPGLLYELGAVVATCKFAAGMPDRTKAARLLAQLSPDHVALGDCFAAAYQQPAGK